MIRRAAMFCIFISLVFAVSSCSNNGNSGEVNNPSTVTILTPWNDTTREGIVEVKVDAVDMEGIKEVDLYVGGKLLGKAVAEPYNFQWDTGSIPNGTSTKLFARAVDIYGKITDSATITVKKGATLTPVVTITSPAGSVTIKQGDAVTLKGSATNGDSALADASLSWSSDLQGAILPNTWSQNPEKAGNFQFKGLGIGQHTITLTAANSDGVTASASTTIIVTPNTGKFALVPAGTYYVGMPLFAKSKVTLSRSFLISKTEMTVQEFLNVMLDVYGNKAADLKKNFVDKRNALIRVSKTPPYVIPEYFELTKTDPPTAKYAEYPVAFITYFEACLVCNTMSKNEGLQVVYSFLDSKGNVTTDLTKVSSAPVDRDANGYRLPTEAEFEVAARGGLYGKKFPWGDTQEVGAANTMSDQALVDPFPVYNGRGPTPVKSYAPNAFGIYDMAGNVAEMMSDIFTGRVPSGFNPLGIEAIKKPPYLLKGGTWAGFLDDSMIAVRSLNMSSNSANDDGMAGIYGMRVMRYAQ